MSRYHESIDALNDLITSNGSNTSYSGSFPSTGRSIRIDYPDNGGKPTVTIEIEKMYTDIPLPVIIEKALIASATQAVCFNLRIGEMHHTEVAPQLSKSLAPPNPIVDSDRDYLSSNSKNALLQPLDMSWLKQPRPVVDAEYRPISHSPQTYFSPQTIRRPRPPLNELAQVIGVLLLTGDLLLFLFSGHSILLWLFGFLDHWMKAYKVSLR